MGHVEASGHILLTFSIAEAEVLVVIVSLQSLTTLASPKFQASARNATATYSNTAGRSLAK